MDTAGLVPSPAQDLLVSQEPPNERGSSRHAHGNVRAGPGKEAEKPRSGLCLRAPLRTAPQRKCPMGCIAIVLGTSSLLGGVYFSFAT